MPHADPEARRAYYREWKKTAKAKLKNGLYDRAKHANERAIAYGVDGRITTADVRRILSVGRCHWCAAPWKEIDRFVTLDHVVPMDKGGVNEPANIVAACRSCNTSKHRGEQPGRWSRTEDACLGCHRSDRKHLANGLCVRCHAAARYQQKKTQRDSSPAV